MTSLVRSPKELTAAELFPNAKAASIIEECAQQMAPIIWRMESAKLQVQLSPRNYGMTMVVSRWRNEAENIAGRYLTACTLKDNGQYLEQTPVTAEQSRFFFWSVYKRAHELADPQIRDERRIIFGPSAD